MQDNARRLSLNLPLLETQPPPTLVRKVDRREKKKKSRYLVVVVVVGPSCAAVVCFGLPNNTAGDGP